MHPPEVCIPRELLLDLGPVGQTNPGRVAGFVQETDVNAASPAIALNLCKGIVTLGGKSKT